MPQDEVYLLPRRGIPANIVTESTQWWASVVCVFDQRWCVVSMLGRNVFINEFATRRHHPWVSSSRRMWSYSVTGVPARAFAGCTVIIPLHHDGATMPLHRYVSVKNTTAERFPVWGPGSLVSSCSVGAWSKVSPWRSVSVGTSISSSRSTWMFPHWCVRSVAQ